MHRFDYSFLQDILVPASLMTRVSMVEGLRVRTQYSRKGREPVLDDMHRLTRLISVQAARRENRLFADDGRLVELFLDRVAPETYDEHLLIGYRDAMTLIQEHHSDMRICTGSVQRIYSVLVSGTGEDTGFRVSDGMIMLPNTDSEPRYIKSPVRAADVKVYTDYMLEACSIASTDLGINKYLLISSFMLDFLCVQPFRKHNGMMARLCVMFLMYRMGLDIQHYVSYDQVVYMYLQSHYDAFIQGTEGWEDGTNDYVPYITEFARDLFICFGFFERRMRGMRGTNEKALRIYYQVITSPLPLSKRDVCEFLPDISEAMVEQTLTRLVKQGSVKRIGAKKNARYLRAVDRWY